MGYNGKNNSWILKEEKKCPVKINPHLNYLIL